MKGKHIITLTLLVFIAGLFFIYKKPFPELDKNLWKSFNNKVNIVLNNKEY